MQRLVKEGEWVEGISTSLRELILTTESMQGSRDYRCKSGRYQRAVDFCPPLRILLEGTEWRDRDMSFDIQRVDVEAFKRMTDNTRDDMGGAGWGFAEWWTWGSKGPSQQLCPRWWKDPPTWLVSGVY